MKLKELLLVSAIYFFLTLIFFHKIFIGLIPLPTDLIVGGYYPWINYEKGSGIGVPVKNPKLSDAVSIFYPLKSLSSEIVKSGDSPLWNPYMFGGYPLFTNPTLGLFFPTSIFYLFLSGPVAWTLQTMSQPLLAAIFTYLLLRHLKLPKLASFFGGTVYGFGGFTILWMQWNSIATTSLFLPILILLEDKYMLDKKPRWGILLAIFFCLQLFAGYLPIISLTLVCMAAWYLFFTKNIGEGFKVAFYIFLGACLSAFFLLPLGELISISQRTSETLGTDVPFILPQNLVNLIAPDFFGNDATYNFWGQGDHMDSTIYVGIATIVLTLVALNKIFTNRYVKFAFFLFILAMIISLPNPIGSFIYKLGLWGGSSITMNRINFVFNFSLAILASFGLSSIRKPYSKLSLKPALLVISTLISLVAGLMIYKIKLGVPLKINTLLHFSDQGNISLIHSNVALRNLAFPTALAIAVFSVLLVVRTARLKTKFLKITFILILVFDLFRFGWKFNTFSSPKYIYPKNPISDFLKMYPNDRFVAEKDIFPANMWVPYKLSAIGGYDSLYPLRTAKLIAVANSGKVDATPQPRWGILNNFSSRLLDVSNVRFLVALKKEPDGKVSSNGQINNSYNLGKYQEVYEDNGIVILENKNNLPRTFLTKEVRKASDKEALGLLINDQFPIDKIAITSDYEFSPQSELPLIYSSDYNPINNTRIVVNTDSNQDAYLIVSDSYYPGWKVLVDDKESTIHRTNYNFRGVFLQEGKHKVEFIYSPKSLKYGLVISGIAIFVGLIILRRDLNK